MFRMRDTLGGRWQRAADEHAAAVAALLVAASLVPEEKWQQPLPPGRWSPAQRLLQVAEAHRLGGSLPLPPRPAEMGREALSAYVQALVVSARNALREAAATGDGRLRHPTGGSPRPVSALRRLSAHTREQARRLAPPKLSGGDFQCLPDLSPAGSL